jgi:hypothetical protein
MPATMTASVATAARHDGIRQERNERRTKQQDSPLHFFPFAYPTQVRLLRLRLPSLQTNFLLWQCDMPPFFWEHGVFSAWTEREINSSGMIMCTGFIDLSC